MEGKRKETQQDLDYVQSGKKSMRTMFKSEKDANGLVNAIENVNIFNPILLL